MRTEYIRQRMQEVQASVLKDVDKKLNVMVEDIIHEIKKETTLSSEFKQLFSEDNGNGNGYKRKPFKNGTLPEKEFMPRNSLLTDLIEVKHIRTIYHIFIVIMSMMFLNTVMYDLVEGRIYIGVTPIIKGFANIHWGFLIWIPMQLSTLLVYPSFVLWANMRQLFPQGLKRAYDYGSILIYILYTAIFVYGVTKAVVACDLGLASSTAVLMELTRFIMKTYAFIRSNVSTAKLPKKKGKKTAGSGSSDDNEDKAGFYVPEFKKFLYFLFAPTLIYRHNYPRTNHIKWRFVLRCALEVIGTIFYVSFVLDRFVIPLFADFGKVPSTAITVLYQIFSCMMPGMMFFTCAFYLLLHSWMNGWAEMLTFADRMFYQDWWNSTSYPDYYRTWNIVVHDWLYTYIYKDCYEHVFKKSKVMSMLAVFTVSAIVHEYIIVFTFHFFYPVMLVLFQGIGVIVMFVSNKNKNVLGNIFLWWSLFCGNGVMFALYSQEYMARNNCVVGDSLIDYVIPVSWYC